MRFDREVVCARVCISKMSTTNVAEQATKGAVHVSWGVGGGGVPAAVALSRATSCWCNTQLEVGSQVSAALLQCNSRDCVLGVFGCGGVSVAEGLPCIVTINTRH